MFSAEDIRIAVCQKPLDAQFLSTLEMYDSTVKYLRIDADIASALKQGDNTVTKDELVALFQKVSGNNELKVEFATLKDASVPALITLSEESRRMDEMLKLYAMNGMNMGMGAYRQQITLTLKLSSPLIAKLEAMEGQKQEVTAAYLYGLAQLSQKKLSAEELQKFLADSYTVLELL
jgi:molecular chaperone HtpG